MKEKAAKQRIGDIRIANRDVYGNQPVLAGYLRMANTGEPHDSIASSASATGNIAHWHRQRTANYDIVTEPYEIQKARIFDFAGTEDSIDEGCTERDEPEKAVLESRILEWEGKLKPIIA